MKRGGLGRAAASAALLAAALPALPVPGQTPPVCPQQNPAVFRVTTRLVVVSVIVKDKQGQLVAGLTSNDFTVYDDGQPQRIAVFEVEQTHAPAILPPVPPGTFTNLAERQAGTSPVVTVILLDGLNTPWVAQASARQQVIKFLQEQIQPEDRVGLYSLSIGGLTVLHDFTSDSAALIQALAQYRGHLLPGDTASASSEPQFRRTGDLFGQSGGAGYHYYPWQSGAETMWAFIEIADHLRGVQGRKNLVWVSSGVPPLMRGLGQQGTLTLGMSEGQVRRAAQALNDTNVAIYPVDAQGLMVHLDYMLGSLSGNGYRGLARLSMDQGTMASAMRPALPPQDPAFHLFDAVAHRTGGRAFYNLNDIQGSIRRVIDDSRLSYLIGYYPTNTQWNGAFHKMKVRVVRPGLRLQYRNGYHAVPPEPDGVQPFDAAVFGPLDATGLGLTVKASPVRGAAGTGKTMLFELLIDAHDLTLSPEGEPSALHVKIALVELDKAGNNLKGVRSNVSADVKPGEREKFLADGLPFSQVLPILPNAERIRAVVRDDLSGNIGSVTIPVDRILAQSGR